MNTGDHSSRFTDSQYLNNYMHTARPVKSFIYWTLLNAGNNRLDNLPPVPVPPTPRLGSRNGSNGQRVLQPNVQQDQAPNGEVSE